MVITLVRYFFSWPVLNAEVGQGEGRGRTADDATSETSYNL